MTLEGTGALTASDSAAEIEIQSDAKLINDMKIQGYGVIRASAGTFENGVSESDAGKVLANDDGTLDIVGTNISDVANVGLLTDEPPVFRWGLDGASAILRFKDQDLISPDAELHGHFYVHAGTLRIGTDVGEQGDNIDIETNGDLMHDGGRIIAGEDDSIAFNVQ